MSQRPALLGGIAVLACATVILQIALVRLFAAMFGQPVALLALALPLVGVAVGGGLVHLVPSLARPHALLAVLAYLAGGASLTTTVALLVSLNVKAFEVFDADALLRLTTLYVVASLPFVCVGAALAAAVRQAIHAASRLYFAASSGAAAGVLAAVVAFSIGAPRACLVVAILFALAAVGFYLAARRASAALVVHLDAPPVMRPSGAVVAAFLVTSGVLLAGDLGAPWLKLPALRWAAIDKAELQAWTETALVTVDKPAAGAQALRFDGTASTSILDAKTTPPLQADEIGYALHKDRGPTLIVAPGGGRDVRAALRAGQKEIYAVEPDAFVLREVMLGRYRAASADLYAKPEVNVVLADPRSYLRRVPAPLRSIVVTLADTAGPAAVGANALSPTPLYTVEAFRDYLNALLPEGTLLVSRPEGEADRVFALAAAGLRSVGATAPAEHLYACTGARVTAILIKRSPFTGDEIDVLRRHCKKSKLVEAYAPDQPRTELRRSLLAGSPTAVAALDGITDLTPPVDDRPFFFQAIATRALPSIFADGKALRYGRQGLFGAVLLFLGGVLLTAVLSGLGFIRRGATARSTAPRLRPLLFFTMLGAGFALTALALVPRLVTLIAHPGHALALVAIALGLSAAVGARVTALIAPRRIELAALRVALLLVGSLALLAVAAAPVIDAAAGSPFVARIALGFVVLAPIGGILGALPPLGVKLVASRAPELLPWCSGLAGAGAVIGLSGGALIALACGYSALFLVAGTGILIAAAALPEVEASTANLN